MPTAPKQVRKLIREYYAPVPDPIAWFDAMLVRRSENAEQAARAKTMEKAAERNASVPRTKRHRVH